MINAKIVFMTYGQWRRNMEATSASLQCQICPLWKVCPLSASKKDSKQVYGANSGYLLEKSNQTLLIQQKIF